MLVRTELYRKWLPTQSHLTPPPLPLLLCWIGPVPTLFPLSPDIVSLFMASSRHSKKGVLHNLTRRTSHDTRHTTHVTRHTSHDTRHTSHDTRHTSHVTRHTSHVTRHTAHVTRHTSHDTRHTTHVTEQQPQQQEQQQHLPCIALILESEPGYVDTHGLWLG